MSKVKAKIDTSFGEITIEGNTPEDILEMLENFPKDFIEKTSNLVTEKLTPTTAIHLKGLVEFSTEGPVIVTREDLTHYEAIGLILYATEDKRDTSAHIKDLLKSSGIKSMVPARLHEMTRRGLVFKPDPDQPQYKLTVQGERWVEDEIMAKLKGKSS